MMRVRLLAVLAAGAMTAGPAGAQERSPLEQPDPVSTVRVQLPGSVALAEAESAGIDFSGNPERVPDGVQSDAVVTAAQLTQLKAMGAKLVAPGQDFAWALGKARTAAEAAATTLLAPPASTVRVVRADYFTTKG